ncbi:MAG: dihydrolipoyl dehydrogenase [Firmicutes bacterium]|nr:dihydrolipoyl dehydrogenase [Bacillota bacterium]
MIEKSYDVAVIGGGGGGYPAAFRLAQSGQSVLLIDHHGNLGGNCLYEGCVPSKSVREAAMAAHNIRHSQFFGVSSELSRLSWPAIRAYKDQVQTLRYAQHAQTIQSTANITVLTGEGRLLDDAYHLQLNFTEQGQSQEATISAQTIMIATGSVTEEVPIPGLNLAVTSHDLFAWHETMADLPQDMVILGGGYIGIEAASMLADLGVHVTVVEAGPTILDHMDTEIVAALTERLSTRVTLVTGTRVDKVLSAGARFVVQAHHVTDGTEQSWTTDRVLSALGRVPWVPPELGLTKAGVEFTRHGIVADSRMRTSVPHIFAAGDVNGQSMLFHAAVRMSRIAAETVLTAGASPDTFNPIEMPMTVFSRPAAMSVGLTADGARAQGLRVVEERRTMDQEDWALIVGQPQGFYKFVVAAGSGRIVGIHAIGTEAVGLSAVAHMIVRLGLTPQEVSHMAFPHPTQFEIVDGLAWSVV